MPDNVIPLPASPAGVLIRDFDMMAADPLLAPLLWGGDDYMHPVAKETLRIAHGPVLTIRNMWVNPLFRERLEALVREYCSAQH